MARLEATFSIVCCEDPKTLCNVTELIPKKWIFQEGGTTFCWWPPEFLDIITAAELQVDHDIKNWRKYLVRKILLDCDNYKQGRAVVSKILDPNYSDLNAKTRANKKRKWQNKILNFNKRYIRKKSDKNVNAEGEKQNDDGFVVKIKPKKRRARSTQSFTLDDEEEKLIQSVRQGLEISLGSNSVRPGKIPTTPFQQGTYNYPRNYTTEMGDDIVNPLEPIIIYSSTPFVPQKKPHRKRDVRDKIYTKQFGTPIKPTPPMSMVNRNFQVLGQVYISDDSNDAQQVKSGAELNDQMADDSSFPNFSFLDSLSNSLRLKITEDEQNDDIPEKPVTQNSDSQQTPAKPRAAPQMISILKPIQKTTPGTKRVSQAVKKILPAANILDNSLKKMPTPFFLQQLKEMSQDSQSKFIRFEINRRPGSDIIIPILSPQQKPLKMQKNQVTYRIPKLIPVKPVHKILKQALTEPSKNLPEIKNRDYIEPMQKDFSTGLPNTLLINQTQNRSYVEPVKQIHYLPQVPNALESQMKTIANQNGIENLDNAAPVKPFRYMPPQRRLINTPKQHKKYQIIPVKSSLPQQLPTVLQSKQIDNQNYAEAMKVIDDMPQNVENGEKSMQNTSVIQNYDTIQSTKSVFEMTKPASRDQKGNNNVFKIDSQNSIDRRRQPRMSTELLKRIIEYQNERSTSKSSSQANDHNYSHIAPELKKMFEDSTATKDSVVQISLKGMQSTNVNPSPRKIATMKTNASPKKVKNAVDKSIKFDNIQQLPILTHELQNTSPVKKSKEVTRCKQKIEVSPKVKKQTKKKTREPKNKMPPSVSDVQYQSTPQQPSMLTSPDVIDKVAKTPKKSTPKQQTPRKSPIMSTDSSLKNRKINDGKITPKLKKSISFHEPLVIESDPKFTPKSHETHDTVPGFQDSFDNGITVETSTPFVVPNPRRHSIDQPPNAYPDKNSPKKRWVHEWRDVSPVKQLKSIETQTEIHGLDNPLSEFNVKKVTARRKSISSSRPPKDIVDLRNSSSELKVKKNIVRRKSFCAPKSEAPITGDLFWDIPPEPLPKKILRSNTPKKNDIMKEFEDLSFTPELPKKNADHKILQHPMTPKKRKIHEIEDLSIELRGNKGVELGYHKKSPKPKKLKAEHTPTDSLLENTSENKHPSSGKSMKITTPKPQDSSPDLKSKVLVQSVIQNSGKLEKPGLKKSQDISLEWQQKKIVKQKGPTVKSKTLKSQETPGVKKSKISTKKGNENITKAKKKRNHNSENLSPELQKENSPVKSLNISSLLSAKPIVSLSPCNLELQKSMIVFKIKGQNYFAEPRKPNTNDSQNTVSDNAQHNNVSRVESKNSASTKTTTLWKSLTPDFNKSKVSTGDTKEKNADLIENLDVSKPKKPKVKKLQNKLSPELARKKMNKTKHPERSSTKHKTPKIKKLSITKQEFQNNSTPIDDVIIHTPKKPKMYRSQGLITFEPLAKNVIQKEIENSERIIIDIHKSIITNENQTKKSKTQDKLPDFNVKKIVARRKSTNSSKSPTENVDSQNGFQEPKVKKTIARRKSFCVSKNEEPVTGDLFWATQPEIEETTMINHETRIVSKPRKESSHGIEEKSKEKLVKKSVKNLKKRPYKRHGADTFKEKRKDYIIELNIRKYNLHKQLLSVVLTDINADPHISTKYNLSNSNQIKSTKIAAVQLTKKSEIACQSINFAHNVSVKKIISPVNELPKHVTIEERIKLNPRLCRSLSMYAESSDFNFEDPVANES